MNSFENGKIEKDNQKGKSQVNGPDEDRIQNEPTRNGERAAYNDAAGVTAAFNKNLLVRINRELHGDFDLDLFDHDAVFQLDQRRVEMRLVSRVAQRVHVCNEVFDFSIGDWIVTEHCYKHAPDDFRALSRAAGLEPTRLYTDESGQMGMYEFRVPSEKRGATLAG